RGLLQYKKIEKALSLYVEMQQEGIHPDQTMQIHLMKTCRENPLLMKALSFCHEMQKEGIPFNQIILEEKPGVKTYNSLINAYVRANNLAKAFSIFEEMQKMGIKPNVLTYKTFINALL